MGHGDQLLATGFARGAYERGESIAFGDPVQQRIEWDHHSPEIFRGNPNIAEPGTENHGAANLKWIHFCRGHRIYNRDDNANQRWIWNYDFRPPRGELFFSPEERLDAAQAVGKEGFVVVEPHAALHKTVEPNKTWPEERFQHVAHQLRRDGHDVVQFEYSGIKVRLRHARLVPTKSFRRALALLERAALIVVSEGGLHHGAAAVNVPAVVLFGGFIPPQITGYDGHANLAAEDQGPPCGKYVPCAHCISAIRSISAERVLEAARGLLVQRKAA